MNRRWAALVGVVILCLAYALVAPQAAAAARGIEITTLSTHAQLVTGGTVLVQISLPPEISPSSVRVTVGSNDVTSAFEPSEAGGTLLGLVTGLSNGKNVLRASTTGAPRASASVELMNHPLTGPVLSGPWLQPFICQTEMFTLPDGTKLGPPLDANCSAATVVQYIYRSTDAKATFKPLPSSDVLPPDVAATTTLTGATVKFIVRIETGTMNRGIYQNAILHDPTSEMPPTPFAPPRGWNRRLVALHGVGCPTGWYVQGAAQGVDLLDAVRLGQGYALFTNTLNHPTNSCNAVLAGETTMMGKEHFIETFGVPFYTVSVGRSGGAYTSLQVADAFPGLFDGISISLTFPDALGIALAGLEGRLLMRYFTYTAPSAFTDEQKLAISGYSTIRALLDAANQAQRTDPVPDRMDLEGYQSARWNPAVPESLRYDPVENPRGARPTIFDVARNIYGINPATGAALRPFDNVGVQYGLTALNSGAITTTQFLDLNEGIGGFDEDANPIPARSRGDAGAIKRAYQSGLMLSGGGGLASIPIVDNANSNEREAYHYGWFHWALRERLRQANGHSDNMVMWRNTTAESTQALFDRWMEAYKADTSTDTPRVKVARARPTDAADGCFDTSTPPRLFAEDLVFSSKPTSKCSELFPVHSHTRKEAGEPLAANVLKCQLEPIDGRDYAVTFTPEETVRLKRIFPDGVCDWSKPGVNQTPVVPWTSWGPSPKVVAIPR